MAISFVSGNNYASSNSLSLVCPAPASIVAGNLLIAILGNGNNNSITVTPPSGWTEWGTGYGANSTCLNIYWKVATGSEPASYTFGVSQTNNSMVILQYSGVNTTTPFDTAYANSTASGATTASWNTFATTYANEQVLLVLADYNGETFSTPAGTTNEQQAIAANSSGTYAFDFNQATAGTIGSYTSTITGGSDNYSTYSFALVPAGSSTPADSSVPKYELPLPVNEFPPLGPPAIIEALLGPGPQPATTYQAGSNLQDPNRYAVSWIIPGYQYPTTGIWNQAPINSGGPAGKPGYIIANASSGPGTTVDANYATAIANAVAAGWTVMGYVDTNYNAVALSTIQKNVGLWNSLYGVTNIFFDRANNANTAASLIYCQAATAYARQFGGLSIMNMGTTPASFAYFNKVYCDGIIVFENNQATFKSSPPPTVGTIAGFYIGHIIYGVSTDQTSDQVKQSVALGANMLFVTDESDTNYDLLPSYVSGENLVFTGLGSFSTSVGAPPGAPPAILPFPPIGPPPVIAALFGPGVPNYGTGTFRSITAAITPGLSTAATGPSSGSTVQLTAALTPGLTVADAANDPTELVQITAAVAPSLAVAASAGGTTPLTAALTPGLSIGGPGTVALVQETADPGNLSGSGSRTQTFPSNTTVGNWLIFVVTTDGSHQPSISGGGVGTWLYAANDTNGGCWLVYGQVTSSGQSAVTFTPTGGDGYIGASGGEWSGVNNSSPVVAASGADGSSPMTPPAQTATAAGQLYIGGGYPQSGVSPGGSPPYYAANSGYTTFSTLGLIGGSYGSANAYECSGYTITTGSGSYQISWSGSGGGTVTTSGIFGVGSAGVPITAAYANTGALGPNLAIAATSTEAVALTAAIAPSLAVAANASGSTPITAALTPSFSISATNAETAALTGSSTPALAVSTTNVESVALTAAIAPSLAVAASGPTTILPLTAALTPNLAVAATNTEAVAITAASTPALAIAGTNKEAVAITATSTPNLALAATGPGTTLAISAALTPGLAVAASNAESVALTAALTSSLAIAAQESGGSGLSTSITPSLAVAAADSVAVSYSVSATPSLAVAATNAEAVSITAALTPGLAISATNAEAAALTSAQTPNLAIAAADTKAVTLTAALTPGLAVAASNAEAVALTGTSTPSLVLAATPTEAVAVTAALGPFLAIQALNGGASPLTSAITPSLAVSASNAEVVSLTAALTPGLAVTATNKETVALSAAPAPALAIATVNTEAVSVSAALAPALSITANNGESLPITASITPSSAVTASNAERVALSAAPTPALAVSAATQTKVNVSSSLTPNLAITATMQEQGLVVYITTAITAALSLGSSTFHWFYVGHESASTVVQPAMDFNQESATTAVQPALDFNQQSATLTVQPALY